ncbi:MAG: hypothetical protein ACKVP7_07560 [Hyphomicrobiaceae bacterium]
MDGFTRQALPQQLADEAGEHVPHLDVPGLRDLTGRIVDDDSDVRHGPPLGRELHAAVYVSVAAAYGWMLLAAWIAFGKVGRPDFDLAIATVILLMFLALPFIGFRISWAHSHERRPSWVEFLSSTIDTATGPLSAGDAWIQILIVPGSLALAATLIGFAYRLFV